MPAMEFCMTLAIGIITMRIFSITFVIYFIFSFAGSVIKAWDIGVATMKLGEIAMLTCRSDYAYGKNGSPPTIPPDATLIFEV